MAETGTVQIKHSPGQERYEAAVTGADGTDVQVGYLDYVAEIEQVVLTHTVIFERFSGHGYAGQLVKAVLDERAAGIGRHDHVGAAIPGIGFAARLPWPMCPSRTR